MAVVVIIFQFFVLRHEVILEYDNNNKVVTYGLRSLADAIILLMPYWVLPAKYRHWIWLIEYHGKYMKLGKIPSYAYENFCEMYEAYHRLGGNGMITKMKQEIEELHLKQKGE